MLIHAMLPQKGVSVPTALSTLRKLMRTSTTSLSAVPKPLKYLKDSYDSLKAAHERAEPDTRARLADIVSVLAVAAAPAGSRECLDYCLRGTLRPGDWGHEYVRRLEMEIVEAWPLAHEDEIAWVLFFSFGRRWVK